MDRISALEYLEAAGLLSEAEWRSCPKISWPPTEGPAAALARLAAFQQGAAALPAVPAVAAAASCQLPPVAAGLLKESASLPREVIEALGRQRGPLTSLAGLQVVDLSGLGLAALPLKDLCRTCPGLRRLFLDENVLSSLDGLEALPNLEELSVARNAIQRVSGLQALTALQRLCLDGNRLTALPEGIGGLTALRQLAMAGNDLAAIPEKAVGPGLMAGLESLDVSGNRLGSLGGISLLVNLQSLDLSRNGLEAVEGLDRLPVLLTLAATNNRLPGVPRLGSALLRELRLSGNRIGEVRDLPFLPHLETLHLQDNEIATLSPLAGLPSLRELNLSFNSLFESAATIQHVAAATALRVLQLNDNPLAAAAGYRGSVLRCLPWLEELDNEPVPSEQREALRLRAVAGSPWNVPLFRRAGPLHPADAAEAMEARSRRLCGLAEQLVASAHSQHVRLFCEGPAAGAWQAQQLHAAVMDLISRQQAQLTEALRSHPRGRRAHQGGPSVGSAKSDLGPLLWRHHKELLELGKSSAPQPMLVRAPGYCNALDAARGRGATLIQAHWRGLLARRLAARLRRQQAELRRHSAAACIQAVWRGLVWRRGPDLALLRSQLASRRSAAAHAQQRQRAAAAVRIQAVFRGHRLRRRLRAALKAARLSEDEDWDLEEAFDVDGFLGPMPDLDWDLDIPPEIATRAAAAAAAVAAAAAAARAPAPAVVNPSPVRQGTWQAPAPPPLAADGDGPLPRIHPLPGSQPRRPQVPGLAMDSLLAPEVGTRERELLCYGQGGRTGAISVAGLPTFRGQRGRGPVVPAERRRPRRCRGPAAAERAAAQGQAGAAIPRVGLPGHADRRGFPSSPAQAPQGQAAARAERQAAGPKGPAGSAPARARGAAAPAAAKGPRKGAGRTHPAPAQASAGQLERRAPPPRQRAWIMCCCRGEVAMEPGPDATPPWQPPPQLQRSPGDGAGTSASLSPQGRNPGARRALAGSFGAFDSGAADAAFFFSDSPLDAHLAGAQLQRPDPLPPSVRSSASEQSLELIVPAQPIRPLATRREEQLALDVVGAAVATQPLGSRPVSGTQRPSQRPAAPPSAAPARPAGPAQSLRNMLLGGRQAPAAPMQAPPAAQQQQDGGSRRAVANSVRRVLGW